jgi:hypothetical protein
MIARPKFDPGTLIPRTCALRLGDQGSRGSRFVIVAPNLGSGKLDRPVKYRFFRRSNFLAHGLEPAVRAARFVCLGHGRTLRRPERQPDRAHQGTRAPQGGLPSVAHPAIASTQAVLAHPWASDGARILAAKHGGSVMLVWWTPERMPTIPSGSCRPKSRPRVWIEARILRSDLSGARPQGANDW